MVHVLYRIVQYDLVVALLKGLHHRVGVLRHAIKVVRVDGRFVPVVRVVRVPDDESAPAEILLRNTEALVVAVRVFVDGHVRIAVELVDVLLEIER